MQYAEAISRLFALQSRGVRLGKSRMQQALALRGHPERGMRCIQVAGTNGKGSASAMMASCLRAAGYKTGLYTSPHLHRFVERVQIDGRPLGEREAARRIGELLEAFSAADAPELSFFEITTLLAIETFAAHRCEVVVLEVGLGGRLDATTAVPAIASVITRVALDHTNVLGDTMADIAREKAGILRPRVAAAIGVRDESARQVIDTCARETRTPLWHIDREFGAQLRSDGRIDAFVRGHTHSGLRVSLAGAHQVDNVACALAGLALLERKGLPVSDAAIVRGLARVRWPARLEHVPGRPRFLFDAAHNEDGCLALARYLDERPLRGNGRRVLVFGAMSDKDFPTMLRLLAPRAARIVVCAPPMPRAAPPAELARLWPGAVQARSVADALARARRAAGPEGQVVVAGSIFLVADARARALGVKSDPLIRM